MRHGNHSPLVGNTIENIERKLAVRSAKNRANILASLVYKAHAVTLSYLSNQE